MARVLRTSQAEEDLLEIWSYIAEDDIGAADRVIDEFEVVCCTLAETPFMGRERGELAERLRSFPVGSYVIFYRPATDGADGIVIIRVLHGARDLSDLL